MFKMGPEMGPKMGPEMGPKMGPKMDTSCVLCAFLKIDVWGCDR